MNLYTHYSVYKNEIFLRYLDDKGYRRSKFVPFQPRYYIESLDGKSSKKTIYGKNLELKRCRDIKEFRKRINEYRDVEDMPIYGSQNAALQYIAREYQGDLIERLDASKIRRLNIDIETTVDNSVGFPSIVDPVEEIYLISAYDTLFKKMIVFHLHDMNFKDPFFQNELDGLEVKGIYCENEEELLEKFIRFIVLDYPDIFSGWNIDNFDIPYLINRIEKVLGEDQAKRLSPLGLISKREFYDDKGRDAFEYKIKGIEIVDTLKLYQSIELEPRESYSLEFISQYELNVGKLHHPSGIPGHMLYKEYPIEMMNLKSDWGKWEPYKNLILEYKKTNDPRTYAGIRKHFNEAAALYNILDVYRTYQIEVKKDLFDIAYFLAYYSYSNISDILSSMKFWSNLLFVFCYNEMNVLYPMFKSKKSKKGKYQGAYVREPLVGLYKGPGCVVTYDVASMYPSLIRVLNISPETLCNKKYDVDVERLLSEYNLPDIDERHSVGANGAAFDKEKWGVLPQKVEQLFNRRKQEKKLMLKLDSEIEEINKELERRGEL